jgi:hypothetical protein
MAARKYPSDEDVQILIRGPKPLKKWLVAQVEYHGSSLAFEVSRHLKKAMADESSKNT